MADLAITPYTLEMANESVVPESIPLHLLQASTDNFSEVHVLGRGGYGTVYKGVFKDGETMAVKLLSSTMHELDEDTFKRELYNLASVRHPNIVRLVGFCHETRQEMVPHDGKFVLAGRIHMALCLEYMCNGSLAKYLSDELNGQDWHTNYRIIKGICKGLKCLHEESNTDPILHLDLKPDNILLDEKMEPKIADFGLSRLLREDRTQITKRIMGTLGYVSPETINDGVISKTCDIFSLGAVIMKIVVGSKANYDGMSSHEFIDHVHGIWMNRLKASPKYASDLESYSEQVRRCIEIILECVETDRHKRPSIGDIVDKLEKTETMISFPPTNGQGSSTDQMMPFMSGNIELLDAHPLRLSFPFEQNKLISCPLRVKNKTDHYVAFRCLPKTRERCFSKLWQLWGTLPPRSTRTYVVTVGKQQQQPPDVDELAVIQSCVVPCICNACKMDFAGAIERTGAKPHQVTLMAVFSQAEDPTTSEPIRPVMKMIQCADGYGEVQSIDIHPKAPWILTGHAHGYVSIWNYETQKKVMAVNVREEPGLLHSLEHSSCPTSITSTRFAPKADWFAVGDACGYIHVHRYRPNGAVKVLKILKAHSRGVSSLAIHPSKSLLLSSQSDGSIKVWNWEDGWECTGRFEAHSRSIVFDPRDNDTFASVSTDGTVEIWNIYSPDRPEATLHCLNNMVFSVDYFTPGGDNWHIITGTANGFSLIWDLRTNTHIAMIQGSNLGRWQVTNLGRGDKIHHFTKVGVTDNLDGPPLLITTHQNVVSLLNSTNYRRENTIEFDLGQVYGCVYIKRTTSKDSRNRLAIAMDGGIAIMEIIDEDPSYTKENRV